MSEASDFIDNYVLLISDRHRSNSVGPGQVVMGFSDKRRKMLQELKGSDWDNIRLDTIFGNIPKKRKGRWGISHQ